MNQKHLIINADDYGLTRGVSSGIRDAHLNGIVSSSTAMMNMSGVDRDLLAARDLCPSLGLGVHLVLTAGTPLLPSHYIPSLIDAEGRFFPLAEYIQRLPQMNHNEVKSEWRAQIERFCSILDQPPDHLDSHHFASYLSAEVFEIMVSLAQEYHCPIRFLQDLSLGSVVSGLPPSFTEAFHQFSQPLLSTHRVRHPDRLLIDFFDAQATQKRLLELLHALQPGVTELMCHPGHPDSHLMAVSSYAHPRQRELDILMDIEAKKVISELGIELVGFPVLKQ
jgi:predicted glycoside hydrolase/deacetylase ChbG (UPF0249 family)